MLSKEQILLINDIETRTVKVPEWGGEVLVRGLTAAQRDAFEESMFTGQGKDRKENLTNLRARFCALVIVGEDGKPMFSAEELGKMSAKVVQRIFKIGQDLSGLSDKAVEELTGN